MLAIFKSSKWILLICFTILLITPMANLSGETNHYNKITYVAIGDSLTEGLLADRTISETNGYVDYITDALHDNGYKVETYNFAKSGATSLEVQSQLNAINILRHDPDIITVSVGVNDLIPHLKPIQQTDFKENFSQAQTTLQLYETHLSNLHDLTVYTEGSYNTLTNHLKILQYLLEHTMNNVDTKKEKKQLKKYISSIEQALENIQATTKILSGQELKYNRTNHISVADLNDLLDEVQTAMDDLTVIHGETLDKVLNIHQSDFFPVFEDSASSFIKEPDSFIAKTNELINKVATQLQTMDDTIHDTKTVAEIVPKSEEIINESVQLIEASFKDAHEEIDTIGKNIKTIIVHAQEINPNINMYILGYYNMFPYLSDGMQQKTTLLLQSLNEEIETVAENTDITFVPNYDVFEGNYKSLLPNKHDIHPGIEGYQALAKEFITAINKDYPSINRLKINN